MKDSNPTAAEFAHFDLKSGSSELTLRITREALDALTLEIGTGFLSIPRRGAEVGGILGGAVTEQGSGWNVIIDSITPVPVQYQYGPSFRLSIVDRQRFREAASHGSHGGRPIGWYRSNTRPERDPDEADRQITQSVFAGGNSVFLFCEPSGDGRIRAACILSAPQRPELAFAFDLGRFSKLDLMLNGASTELTRPGADPAALTRPGADPAATLAAISARQPEIALPAPPLPPPTPPPQRMRTGGFVRAAIVLAVIAGLVYYVRDRIFVTPAPTVSASTSTSGARALDQASAAMPSLGLRAEYQGNSLLIAWDRGSPQVRSAAAAIFTIADGPRLRVLNLSTRELQNGSILYKPGADEINVELNVTSASGAAASQSIRIIGASGAASNGTTAERAPRVIQQAPAAVQSAATAPPASAPLRFERPETTKPAAPKPRSIAAPDAPAIDLSQPRLVAGSLPSPALLPPPPAERQAPLTRPATPAQSPAAQSPAASTGAPAPREFHPAVPVHSPQPPLPPGSAVPDYAYDRNLQVQVEVTINANGHVTDARLTGQSGPYATLLGPPALNTARMWTFHPATIGGAPIESRMVLTFHYARRR